jgi:hypothetical protein
MSFIGWSTRARCPFSLLKSKKPYFCIKSLQMNLKDLSVIVRQKIRWIALFSILTSISAWFFLSSRKGEGMLILKSQPIFELREELKTVLPVLPDVFEFVDEPNSELQSQMNEFIQHYAIDKVVYVQSSNDTINYWYKVYVLHDTIHAAKMADEFYRLANEFIATNAHLHPFSSYVDFIQPLMDGKKVVNVSVKPLHPTKGALTVFLISVILSSLFFAFLHDLKNVK